MKYLMTLCAMMCFAIAGCNATSACCGTDGACCKKSEAASADAKTCGPDCTKACCAKKD